MTIDNVMEKVNSHQSNRKRACILRRALPIAVVLCICIRYLFTFQEQRATLRLYAGIQRDPLADLIGTPDLHPSEEQRAIGDHAMVSSDVPECSSMGKAILQRGGNAADAAVTVALCLGSINLHSSGIGGGGYIVSSNNDAEEPEISIDAREMAPLAAYKDLYVSNPILSQVGGLAVAIPGELLGLEELYKRHGSGNLTWYELFAPVIELNRKGFECSVILSRAIGLEVKVIFPFLRHIAESWDFVYKDDGTTPISEGDTITRHNLANTLELIARNGSSEIFYDPDGPIVGSLVEAANRVGGILTKDDFAHYSVRVEKPLTRAFELNGKKHRVLTSAGASSGLALIAGLNFYDEATAAEDSDLLSTHKLIEGMKWIASARSHFGDFELHKANGTYRRSLIERYGSTEWSEGIISSGNYSDKQTFPFDHYEPAYQLTEPHGTTHFSVVDDKGNAVGMTTTVNLLFGSMVYDNKTGIILNNEMDDFLVPGTANAFNLTPSIYNFIEPYKRPLLSVSPTIISDQREDGTFHPKLIIGAAGGSRITTAVFQSIVRVIYQNFDLLRAILYPRVHHQLIPEFIMVEHSSLFQKEHQKYGTESIQRDMEGLGHDFFEGGSMTSMNGIARMDTGTGSQWEGVGDYWRKRGGADGY